MRKFGSLLLVSLLSGGVTLGAYKLFLEPNTASKITLANPNYAKNVSLAQKISILPLRQKTPFMR